MLAAGTDALGRRERERERKTEQTERQRDREIERERVQVARDFSMGIKPLPVKRFSFSTCHRLSPLFLHSSALRMFPDMPIAVLPPALASPPPTLRKPICPWPALGPATGIIPNASSLPPCALHMIILPNPLPFCSGRPTRDDDAGHAPTPLEACGGGKLPNDAQPAIQHASISHLIPRLEARPPSPCWFQPWSSLEESFCASPFSLAGKQRARSAGQAQAHPVGRARKRESQRVFLVNSSP